MSCEGPCGGTGKERMGRSAWARSCVRPAGAAPVAACPDEVRGPAPVIIPTRSKLNDMTGWPGPRFARLVLVTHPSPSHGVGWWWCAVVAAAAAVKPAGRFRAAAGRGRWFVWRAVPERRGRFCWPLPWWPCAAASGRTKACPWLEHGSDLGVGAHPRDQAGRGTAARPEPMDTGISPSSASF